MTEVARDSCVLTVYDLLLVPVSRAVNAWSAVTGRLYIVVVVVRRPFVDGQRRVTAAARKDLLFCCLHSAAICPPPQYCLYEFCSTVLRPLKNVAEENAVFV